jgi:aminobenzoyl-glutamate utilization protein B
VVQAHATVRYLVRARELPTLHSLLARVEKVAQGAALMTETSMRCQIINGDANLLGNAPLERLMQANLDRLGPPQFDDADRALATKFQATLSPEDIAGAYERFGLEPRDNAPLCDVVIPLGAGSNANIGSTDVGTVSWVVPTVQMRGATCAIGTPGHSWQLVAQGKTAAAHKGMEHAAKVMAGTAVDLLRDPALVEQAKADLARRLAKTPFVHPIPEGVNPPV